MPFASILYCSVNSIDQSKASWLQSFLLLHGRTAQPSVMNLLTRPVSPQAILELTKGKAWNPLPYAIMDQGCLIPLLPSQLCDTREWHRLWSLKLDQYVGHFFVGSNRPRRGQYLVYVQTTKELYIFTTTSMILCKIFSPAKLCRTWLWDSCCLSQNGLKGSQCLKRILEEIRKVVLCHDVIAAKYLAMTF